MKRVSTVLYLCAKEIRDRDVRSVPRATKENLKKPTRRNKAGIVVVEYLE